MLRSCLVAHGNLAQRLGEAIPTDDVGLHLVARELGLAERNACAPKCTPNSVHTNSELLCSLDLVAQLVLLFVDQAKKTKLAASFGPQFKFTLYFTAPNEAEAIGVELCRKLQ